MHKTKIAILLTNPIQQSAINGMILDHGQLYIDFFSKHLASCDFEIFKSYEEFFPKIIADFDAYFITGSVHSANDDLPWIIQLEEFIRKLFISKKKTLGICFGHQIIVKALGGRVETSRFGWQLGMKTIRFTTHKDWMIPQHSSMRICHIHRDQVIEIPQQTEVLSTNENCFYECLLIAGRILTIQGHPEFGTDYSKRLMHAIQDRFSEQEYKTAMSTLNEQDEGAVFGSWIKYFLNQ